MTTVYKGFSAFEDFSLIDLSYEQLVEADFHIGSKLSRFEKLNFNYIFAKRFDIFIMNLSYSLYNLKLAIYFLTYIVSRRGKILFFDSLESTRNFVQLIGVTSRQYYINRKWIAGLLTNFKNFYPAVFTGISRHFRFSEHQYSGMRYIHRPPNVSCLLNIERGSSAFFENFRLGIPTIALVRSDDKFAGVTYPIFANNSSAFTYFSFFSILRAAILNGYKDEIYKFYRKSLKKVLRFRYRKMIGKVQMRNSIISHFREYFLNFFFSNTVFIKRFFEFVVVNIKEFPYISTMFQDLFLYINTHFFKFNNVFSLYKISSSSNTQFFYDLCHRSPVTLLTNSDFSDKIIKIFFLIFFSPDLLKSSILLFNRFFPIFYFLLDKFVLFSNSLNSNFFKLSIKKLNFFVLFLRIWCSYNFKTFLISEYSRNIVHETFPFFEYSLKNTRYFAPLFIKLAFFKVKTFGFFKGFRFFNLRILVKLRRHFFKSYSFKSFTYSKIYKRFFRVFNKRIKFIQFLRKHGYPKHVSLLKRNVVKSRSNFLHLKKNKFKDFPTNVIIKNLDRRSRFNTLQKAGMLQYFDEEFEDFKFPVNNEFFFLQVAYGSAFLSRQYQRSKSIELQKDSYAIVKAYRKKLFKLRNRVRLNRSLLFFFFIKNNI
jgi:small subunit ribosomal protein S2